MSITNTFSPISPNDTDRFGFNFNDWLDEGDTLVSANVYPIPADGNITVGGNSIDTNNVVWAWVSTGSLTASYILSCDITTKAGRICTRSANLNVEDL